MRQLNLEFAELHNALFHNGKNFGTKLDPGKVGGLRLVYDRDEKELLVEWNGKVSILPSTSVHSMIEGTPKKPTEQTVHPMVASIASAQVETPYSHVHKGHGHGQTGVGGKVK